MLLDPLIREHRDEIRAVAHSHGVVRVRLFGSRAKGIATLTSDVDLLIDVGPQGPTSPWFPGGLVNDLEALLHTRVDVVSAKWINSLFKDDVLADAVDL